MISVLLQADGLPKKEAHEHHGRKDEGARYRYTPDRLKVTTDLALGFAVPFLNNEIVILGSAPFGYREMSRRLGPGEVLAYSPRLRDWRKCDLCDLRAIPNVPSQNA